MKFRSAFRLQRCAEHCPTVSTSTVPCIVPPPFAIDSNEFLIVRAKVHEREQCILSLFFFLLLANDAVTAYRL